MSCKRISWYGKSIAVQQSGVCFTSFLSYSWTSVFCMQNNKLQNAALLRGNTGPVRRNSVFICPRAEQLRLESEWSWCLVAVSSGFSCLGDGKLSSMASQSRNDKILLDLVQQPGNNQCADCAAPGEYALSDLWYLDILYCILGLSKHFFNPFLIIL